MGDKVAIFLADFVFRQSVSGAVGWTYSRIQLSTKNLARSLMTFLLSLVETQDGAEGSWPLFWPAMAVRPASAGGGGDWQSRAVSNMFARQRSGDIHGITAL
jgi:hypothetical protein